MLVWCKEHARAFCRISISELRRVAPPAFSFLMVISLLLADGVFPVFASKYRSQSSLYINNNLARSTGGGESSDGVLYSRSSNINNIRYRTKARVKPVVSNRGDSFRNGGMDSGSSKFIRSHLHLQLNVDDAEVSEGEIDRRNERGIIDDKKRQAGSRENELNDYEEFSSRLGETSAPSGLPSSLSSSSSSGSSLKSVSVLSSSLSSSPLASSSFMISNSSNSIGENIGYSSSVNSGTYANNPDFNTCPNTQMFTPSSQPETCESLKAKDKCLVLTGNITEMVCRKCQIQDRISIMKTSRLRFCSSYDAASVSCGSDAGAGTVCPLNELSSTCQDYLQEIIANDDLVEKRYAGFIELIGRYDCKTRYSVKWLCPHCKQAYKDWLCSQTIKFFRSGQVVPPCMEFCNHVEEMCPFFRPKLESYAGDHSFICKDPHMNFPSTTSEGNCYGLCDLWSHSEISTFYCSHANLKGNCPLVQTCDKLIQRETISLSTNSTISNNSTSGSNAMSTFSRTPFSLFILQIFCMVLASLLRLPLTLTESQYISEGLT